MELEKDRERGRTEGRDEGRMEGAVRVGRKWREEGREQIVFSLVTPPLITGGREKKEINVNKEIMEVCVCVCVCVNHTRS